MTLITVMMLELTYDAYYYLDEIYIPQLCHFNKNRPIIGLEMLKTGKPHMDSSTLFIISIYVYLLSSKEVSK